VVTLRFYQEGTCSGQIRLSKTKWTSPPVELQLTRSAQAEFVICDCTIEPGIRFRKQYLYWTLPRFQASEHCDRWTMLVSIAQWQLFLAREFVIDQPLPWQPAQEELTPERVQQGLGGLFQQISTPAAPPKARGKSPGWPEGQARTRRERQKVVKKTKKKTKAA